MNTATTSIPAHVPEDRILDYPLAARRVIYDDPYEMIAELHKRPAAYMAPNAFLGLSPGWVFRRSRDAKKIFSDTEHFMKKGSSNFAALIGEDWDSIPTELDPPRHTAWRRVLNSLFTPERVAALEVKVRQSARSYIEKFKDRGHCDFAREFSVPFPVSIFLDLLGLPHDRMEQFLAWEHSLIHSADFESRAVGVRAVKAYLLEAIEERRKNPTDDLISNTLRLKVDGRPVSSIEVFGHCFNLYLGGLDTVTSTIGLHFLHLARNVDQQNSLRSDPSKIPGAMNELLRAYASTSHHRTCAKEIEIGGVTLKPGDRVLLSNPLINRDPEEFDRPDEILFDREATNLTFGFGIHNCLGRHLARREVQVALEEVLAALPEFRIAPGAKIPYLVGAVIHAAEIPLVWTPK